MLLLDPGFPFWNFFVHLCSLFLKQNRKTWRTCKIKLSHLNWKMNLWEDVRVFLICWFVQHSVTWGLFTCFQIPGGYERDAKKFAPISRQSKMRNIKIRLKELGEFLWFYLKKLSLFLKQNLKRRLPIRIKDSAFAWVPDIGWHFIGSHQTFAEEMHKQPWVEKCVKCNASQWL